MLPVTCPRDVSRPRSAQSGHIDSEDERRRSEGCGMREGAALGAGRTLSIAGHQRVGVAYECAASAVCDSALCGELQTVHVVCSAIVCCV